MQELYEGYPEDPTPKIELSMIILRENGAPRVCDAVSLLEEALSNGEMFFSKKLLDSIYGGHWAALASVEGSSIARKYLYNEIKNVKLQWKEIGVSPDVGVGMNELLSIGVQRILCSRDKG